MKKLLSLLSVLTISGTAVPTTIAASPYQKEETIKNGDINYSQTNSLKRNKRQGGHSIGQANYMSHRRQECDLRLYNFVKDLGVISDDTNYTILNVLKQKNAPFTNNYNVDDWTVLNKTNSSATIVTSLCPAFNNDVNGIVVNYLIKRNLDDIAFPLKIWFNEFKIWKEGINFNKKSKEDYKTEFRLRLTTLATALSTVNNRIYINQLFGRVQGLENELSNLKQKIESPDFLTSCQNIGWFASSTTIAIPGVGGLISGISASLAATCGMISEFS